MELGYNLPESGLGFIMASSAKTFEQHPPKIKLSITDTARNDGTVSINKVIMRFRGGEERFSCAFWGAFAACMLCGVWSVAEDRGRIGEVLLASVSSLLATKLVAFDEAAAGTFVCRLEAISCAPVPVLMARFCFFTAPLLSN